MVQSMRIWWSNACARRTQCLLNPKLVFTDMFLSSAFLIQKGVWLEVTGVINEGSDGVVRISAEKISLPLDQERLNSLFIRNEVKNGY